MVGYGASPEATAAAERIGVQLTPGERTGNAFLRKQEATLAQLPGSSPQFAEFAARNREAINRTAAGEMGETASTIDSGVFAAARQRISDRSTRSPGVDVSSGRTT
jgi:hypothetical protein